jgi:drug/metabolite transporter (DMT)-like permease
MRTRTLTAAPLFALALLVAVWSYNWVVMKSVMRYIGPFEFAAMRCLSGSLLLFLLLFVLGRRPALPPLGFTLLIGLFQTAGSTGLTQLALVTGGAGNTAVLTYTLPFWMIPLAALFLGETIGPARLLSLFFAAVGLLLVMQPWEGGVSLQSSCLAVSSGFFWAVGAIFIKALYRRHADVDLLNLTAWQMFFGSLAILPVAWLTHETPVIWSNYLFFALAYNALPATAIAWTLWLYILKALPTDISGLSMLLVPVCGVLLAWILLGEVPDNTKLWGIACIVVGLALTTGIRPWNPSRED